MKKGNEAVLGPECISKLNDRLADANGVVLGCVRPGNPADNLFIGSFNSRLRQECFKLLRFSRLECSRKGRGLAQATGEKNPLREGIL